MPYRDRPAPRECVDGDWPTGPLKPDAPPSAAAARYLVRRLTYAMARQGRRPSTARAVAEAAGIAPATVTNILNGKSWCDIDTLARLERAVNINLWGDEHRK